VRREDFHYDLPEELIAQSPLDERSASRLLVLDASADRLQDGTMRDLPRLLAPGDVLVFNDTKVVAARLLGRKPTGGRVELFRERPLEGCAALVQLRASKPIRPGLAIECAGGTVEVLEPSSDLWLVRLPAPALEFFERWGEVPLPPYIHRAPVAADRERYQSLFARAPGAVAAPTASLHFDAPLIEALERRGIERAFVTLHVGAGTFQPLRVDDPDAHVMHAEWAAVGAETCEAIGRARARGGRVIAVGTTVVRALESAALASAGQDAGAAPRGPAASSCSPEFTMTREDRLAPWRGDTRLFIRPGFRFRVIDALVTNFHLPESTLLMLVCALAGRERVLAAYAHAVRLRYRFFSYGDAMLVVAARGDGVHAAAV
jgi:S-adenosylmethionine:tRNA ribosyltransferase-isomerase